MITVHHLENSRSQRVLWLLEELELPYQVKRYARDTETMLAPPELKAVHPLGKSPVIDDDGLVVAESGAIVEYLMEAYDTGRLRPPVGTAEHRAYVYWLHYAEGSAMLPLLLKLIFGRVESAPAPFIVRPVIKGIVKKVDEGFIAPNLALHFGYINRHLDGQPWFVGEQMTAADVQMSFPLEASLARGNGRKEYPNIAAFVDRIQALPAYQRALEKGGPYTIMGAD